MRTAPVSTIIACYQCADTIDRAADSVFAQTTPPAELWLVDDASPDGGATRRRLDAIAARTPKGVRTEVMAAPVNIGPGEARNLAWARAGQPFIAFLDADDAWHERKLEVQYDWMSAHPEVAMSGHLDQIGAEPLPEIAGSTFVAHEVTRSTLLKRNPFSTRSVMLRADVRARFPAGKRYSDDYMLWLEILLSGGRAFLLPVVLGYQFRPPFSKGGFSDRLLRMELGELDTYARLARRGLLHWWEFAALVPFSLAKYLRRLLIEGVRRGSAVTGRARA